MLNHTERSYVSHLCEFLPNRTPGKRGPRPIHKEDLIYQLFEKIKYNLRWEDLENSTVCHNYFQEIQRRGIFKKIFNNITSDYQKQRLQKTVVDSSDIESHRVNSRVRYSGKYHKYCLKMTVETTEEWIPVDFELSPGSMSDSRILEEMLSERGKVLPYELYLDKGYEKYSRRRELKRQNCQVRMEMKRGNNKKRGPKFKFAEEHQRIRCGIEKIFSWIKSFNGLRYNRLKKWSLIMASFIFVLCYIVFIRLK